jgi:poly(A) polymerase Pap1
MRPKLSKHEKLLEKAVAFGAGFGLVALFGSFLRFDGFSVEKYQTLVSGLTTGVLAIVAAFIAYKGVVYGVKASERREYTKEARTAKFTISKLCETVDEIKSISKAITDYEKICDAYKTYESTLVIAIDKYSGLKEELKTAVMIIDSYELYSRYNTFSILLFGIREHKDARIKSGEIAKSLFVDIEKECDKFLKWVQEKYNIKLIYYA